MISSIILANPTVTVGCNEVIEGANGIPLIEIYVESNEDVEVVGFEFQVNIDDPLNGVFMLNDATLEQLTGYQGNYELSGYENTSQGSIYFIPEVGMSHDIFHVFGNQDGRVIGFGLGSNTLSSFTLNGDGERLVLLHIPVMFEGPITASGQINISDIKVVRPGQSVDSSAPPQYVDDQEGDICSLDLSSDLSSHAIDVPDEFVLQKAFPNPFNPRTRIDYGLPYGTDVSLVIYGINGQKVKTLVRSFKSSGFHMIEWDGCDYNGNEVSTGVYIYQLIAGEVVLSDRVSLVK